MKFPVGSIHDDSLRLENLDKGMLLSCLNSSKLFSVDYLLIEPNAIESTIVHKKTNEFLFVLDGEIIGCVGGKDCSLQAGSYIEIPKGVPHSFENVSNDSCKILSVCCPCYDSTDVYKI